MSVSELIIFVTNIFSDWCENNNCPDNLMPSLITEPPAGQ